MIRYGRPLVHLAVAQTRKPGESQVLVSNLL